MPEQIQNKKYEYKKSVCERFDLRFERRGWAIFTIDENGGLFNCQSDYGDYSYSWPNHGRESFKHFIIELANDTSYFLNKVARANYLDGTKNLSKLKRKIIEIRKDNECTKEQARDAWDFIVDLDFSLSKDYLESEIFGNEAINALCDEPWYVFDLDLDYSPQAIYFAHEVMPMFAELLKKEIEQGK